MGTASTAIDTLLSLAAVSPDFLEALCACPAEAAASAGIRLTRTETALLAAMDAAAVQRLAQPLRERIPAPTRRVFLRHAAAALVALAGTAVAAGSSGCGDDLRELGQALPPASPTTEPAGPLDSDSGTHPLRRRSAPIDSERVNGIQPARAVRPRWHVQLAGIQVQGGLTSRQVRLVVSEHLPEIRHCAVVHRPQWTDQACWIDVGLVIDRDGVPRQVHVWSTKRNACSPVRTKGHRALYGNPSPRPSPESLLPMGRDFRCSLEAVALSWRFPQPAKGQEVAARVSFWFMFWPMEM